MEVNPIIPAVSIGCAPGRKEMNKKSQTVVDVGFKKILSDVVRERGESEALWFVQNSSPELPPGVSSASELLALLLEGK